MVTRYRSLLLVAATLLVGCSSAPAARLDGRVVTLTRPVAAAESLDPCSADELLGSVQPVAQASPLGIAVSARFDMVPTPACSAPPTDGCDVNLVVLDSTGHAVYTSADSAHCLTVAGDRTHDLSGVVTWNQSTCDAGPACRQVPPGRYTLAMEARLYGQFAAKDITVLPALPACRAENLRVRVGEGSAGGGHVDVDIEILNTGLERCYLDGQPRLILRDRMGREVSSSNGRAPFFGYNDLGPAPAILEPALDGQDPPGYAGAPAAQGSCPGGLFPAGASLWLRAPGHAKELPVPLPGGSLPFDYRCDSGPQDYPPVTQPPTLLIGRLHQRGTVAGANG